MKRLALLMFGLALWCGTMLSQGVQIKGKVTSAEDGSALPGASVVVKGTNVATVTDVDGNYDLKVPQGADVLTFGFVGFKSNDVNITGKTEINVELTPDVTNLAEVVVTGVGTATDRRKVAISVETVKSKDLSILPSASVDQALQGKVAGAVIQSVSGQPGQQQNIILRGINTLGSNQPMVMIDGLEVNTDNNYNGSNNNSSSRLADIDLSNVDRIEVVQGAAAATIYGAQGANGVIQIFTKKGTAGITNITFNSSISSNDVIRGDFKYPNKHYYDTDNEGFILDDNNQRMALNSEGYYPSPSGDPSDAATIANKPYKEKTYNPLDEVFRTAYTYNNSLSVTGGNNNLTYAVFLSNLNQESVIRGKFIRNNAKLNLGTEVFKNFKMNLSSTYINSSNTTGGITGQDNVNSPLGTALLTKPYINMRSRDNNGNLLGRLEDDNSVNPLFGLENELFEAGVDRIIENANLNYKPFSFLELDYKYGIDMYSYKYEDLIKNQLNYLRPGIDPNQGYIRTITDKGVSQNSIFTAFLNFKLSDFTFNTQAAFDWRKNTLDEIESRVTGIPAENNINMSRGSEAYISEDITEFVTYGYLLNQKIEYKELLGVSGGFRTDYSSAFGKASKPFTFPRADAYFRPSQLDVWTNLKDYFPELKIRVAYGEAGVQPSAYDRMQTLVSNTIGTSAFLMSKIQKTNEALNVQVSKEFEAGLDLTIGLTNSTWLSNITFSPTYWQRKSEDVIRLIDIPLSLGASSYLDNAFTLSSSGFQFAANVKVANFENFGWDFSTTYGNGITKVDKIKNKKDIVIGATGSGGFVLKEGEKLGAFYGYKALSSISETRSDGSRYIDATDEGNYEIVEGKVVETASRNVVFTDEKVVLGDPTPDFNISFVNKFRLGKAVNLSCQIDWFEGLDVYNQTKQWMYRDVAHSDINKEVSIGGTKAAYVAYYLSQYNANEVNSCFVEDGSFVRFREVTIGIDIAKLTNIKFVKSLFLNLSGHNLFTFTDYTGLDPEAAANINDPEKRGLDLYAFPNYRSYTAGLSVTF